MNACKVINTNSSGVKVNGIRAQPYCGVADIEYIAFPFYSACCISPPLFTKFVTLGIIIES